MYLTLECVVVQVVDRRSEGNAVLGDGEIARAVVHPIDDPMHCRLALCARVAESSCAVVGVVVHNNAARPSLGDVRKHVHLVHNNVVQKGRVVRRNLASE